MASVDAGLYTSWVDGKFYFKAYTFEEIVKKLERWYDFTMVYQDEEVKQMRFTGSINKHSPGHRGVAFSGNDYRYPF